jgi:DNA-binding beta-propeller fold protein YncE
MSPRTRTVRFARRTLASLALVSVVACAAQDDDVAEPTAEVVALGELRDALYPTLFDTILAETHDLELVDDRLYVAEPNTARVTVLDLELDLVRRIGRPGKGPGELTTPVVARVRDGVVSVADVGTGRYEFFDTAGRSLGSIPLRAGDEHVLVGPERVIAIDRIPERYGTIVDSEGTRPFGSIPTAPDPEPVLIPMHQMHRARLDGDSVVLRIPAATGAVEVLGFDGVLRETRVVPDDIAMELAEHQESLARMFGGAVIGSSLVKGVAVSPDGAFVTVASMSETAPVLIHDLDGRRIFLVDVSEHIQSGKVRSARTAVYHDGLLYVIAGASLFAFELTLPN